MNFLSERSELRKLGEGANQPLSLTLSLGERTADGISPSPNLGEGKGEVKTPLSAASEKNYSLLTAHFSQQIPTLPSEEGCKAAFTLAEVLITLGIIGVVAAITMPTLIANHRKKALETSFKKAYANFYNAYNEAMLDSPPLWDDVYTTNPYPELAKAIYAKYRQIKNISHDDNAKYLANVKTYTMKKGAVPECSQLFRNIGSVIAPDGSAVSVSQNCDAVWVVIDTNGIYKGPNAYGHDLFIFNISKKGKFIPAVKESEQAYDEDGKPQQGYDNSEAKKNKCSKDSPSNLNGATCASYALQNKCPDDPSKTYWECLK